MPVTKRQQSKASARSLFDINVAACEAARHRKCICPCKGKLHGKKHSARWRATAFAEFYGEEW